MNDSSGNRPADSRPLGRLVLLVAVLLAVPILPLLALGESFETRIAGWLDGTLDASTVAAAVVGLLASDILLPIPSSVVSTFAGRMLGFWGGAAASWCGMTLGAGLVFALVRFVGRPLARRLAGDEELTRVDVLAQRFGVMTLVLTRPIPVLAEAAVLLLATTTLAGWRFFAAVALANLGLAAGYAALGERVQFPTALALAVVLPLAVGAVSRWCWRTGAHSSSKPGR